MIISLDGERYSLLWLSLGAALTVTSITGLLCYWLGLPYYPGLLFVFAGVFGATMLDKLERVFQVWHGRQFAEPAPEAQEGPQDALQGPLQAKQAFGPIRVNENETTRIIPRISAGAEAIALLNMGMSIRGEMSLRLPGWREMKPEWDYPRWSMAVRSLGANLAPTTGGVGGGGTYVMGFNSLRELFDAVVDGRVQPTYPESGEQESA